MDESHSMSLDLQWVSSSMDSKPDHIDRVRQEIKLLETENEELLLELNSIKDNPQKIIKAFQSKLMARISQLREENEGIASLIEKSRMPGFAEMTKKKVSYQAQILDSSFKKEDEDWKENSRNPFDDIEMSEKGEASTCQNFPIQIDNEHPLRPLEPLQNQ